MTDPEALAALHLRCFPAHPRPWSAGEFASLLESPLNFLLAQPQGDASTDVAARVATAHARQLQRQGRPNAALDAGQLDARPIVSPTLRRTLYLAWPQRRGPLRHEAALRAELNAALDGLRRQLGPLAHLA